MRRTRGCGRSSGGWLVRRTGCGSGLGGWRASWRKRGGPGSVRRRRSRAASRRGIRVGLVVGLAMRMAGMVTVSLRGRSMRSSRRRLGGGVSAVGRSITCVRGSASTTPPNSTPRRPHRQHRLRALAQRRQPLSAWTAPANSIPVPAAPAPAERATATARELWPICFSERAGDPGRRRTSPPPGR
jgi:hypothetical protein